MKWILAVLMCFAVSLSMAQPPSAKKARVEKTSASPPLPTFGDWMVEERKDGFSDTTKCTALSTKNENVFASFKRDTFFISMKGRGGVESYMARVDDGETWVISDPDDFEIKSSVVSLAGYYN
ncbi:MAG: hypothetical protein ABI351_11980, partial [Herbaspirillum sp.]